MIRRAHGSCRTIAAALAAWSAIAAVASCSTGDAADRNRRISDIYVAVLDAALDLEPSEPPRAADGRGATASSSAGRAGSTSTSSASAGTAGSGGRTRATGPSTAGGSEDGGSAKSGGGAGNGAAGGDGGDRGGGKEKKELPLLFLSPLEEGRPFALEVQAAVIERLGERAMIRFVDTQQQAVDAKLEDRPTLDGGVLLRLGRVPPSGDDIHVAVERYEHLGDWLAMRFAVRDDEGGWTATLIDRRPRPAES